MGLRVEYVESGRRAKHLPVLWISEGHDALSGFV